MYQLLLAFNLICAVLLVIAVLMQQGRGAEMGSSFGRGASGALVGAAGSANFVSRATSLLATGFFASALAMAIIGQDNITERVLEGIEDSGSELVPAIPADAEPAAGALDAAGDAVDADAVDARPPAEEETAADEVPAVQP